jgi:hypothetical protein
MPFAITPLLVHNKPAPVALCPHNSLDATSAEAAWNFPRPKRVSSTPSSLANCNANEASLKGREGVTPQRDPGSAGLAGPRVIFASRKSHRRQAP